METEGSDLIQLRFGASWVAGFSFLLPVFMIRRGEEPIHVSFTADSRSLFGL